jgi:hypothetical protein
MGRTTRRIPLSACAFLLASLGAIACDRSSPSEGGSPRGDAAPTANALAACEEAVVLRDVDRLGKQGFPDNPNVTWETLGHKVSAGIFYVEVRPTPDEVGYPKFVFAIGCRAANVPEVLATYAFDKGAYTLLSTKDSAVSVPASPP